MTVRVYRAPVRSAFPYGYEFWAVRVENELRLEVLNYHCLRTILRVKYTDFVSNEAVHILCEDISGYPRNTNEGIWARSPSASRTHLYCPRSGAIANLEASKRRPTQDLAQHDWPPMIPEFLANGLTSPTHSLALVALLTTANLANSELAHLRRLYMISATEFATKDPQFLSQRDSPTESVPIVLCPVKQSWQLRFVHNLGIFGGLLVSAVSLMAPSALTVFWCTSSVHQLLINLAHLLPRVRNTLRVPTSYVDPKRPYITLWLVALQNYRILTSLRPKKL
ncbi:unnamed protein product [Schistocephalus solidus]|uniref:Fungal_trans domain-containing protein n=1 Tax=Schistocephalus solidus TaxID=70667 RepID=A0A183T1B0_SCHSO|nr:unnamed protein product [Schistocephalus solidus]